MPRPFWTTRRHAPWWKRWTASPTSPNESHQFNRHWPFQTGWTRPEELARGAQWTLDQGKEYIFYYGPFIYKEYDEYYEFAERDWLYRFWEAGLPKHHPNMHYYLNAFPHAHGSKRPVGPESDPHSYLGMMKWLIEEVKGTDLMKSAGSD